MDEYLVPLAERPVRRKATGLEVENTLDLSDVPRLVGSLKADQGVKPVRRFKGGAAAAEARLKHYLGAPFAHYAAERGKPEAGAASHMSPYLHFGQVSPVALAPPRRRARAARTTRRPSSRSWWCGASSP